MSQSKSEALAAVVTAAELAATADTVWGRGSQHSAVSRNDLTVAVRAARTAGATDNEIHQAVTSTAFVQR